MNIIIGNQKGGAGKSTLCILLANYLSLVQKTDCLILDMDFQSSIKSLWDKDRANYDNPPLYEVLDIELDVFSKIKDKISQVDGHIIIDLPRKMDDNLLIPVYQCADLVICPFAYDKITFESTGIFAQVVRHLNKDVPIVFVPNRLKSGVRYEIKTQVNEVLAKFGLVFPEFADRIAFQRIDTLSIPTEVEELIRKTFDEMHDQFFNTSPLPHGKN